ncbi:MAG: RES family NAD+ phosphorylase [Defluviicoccus sp.]|nr:RES family NAD+ phosphorylase [Defluviicoccus sp.]MDE0384183.1 RES family NAD+ phosphorylase [Defluviicoccus sp.]
MWRAVREGRAPLACGRPGGRWDDGTFDALYTSETREGAIAERRFHLQQGQPLPPSRVRYALYELAVRLDAVMHFPDLEALAAVGLDTTSWGRLSYAERAREYPRSQDIAEACAFLGADGIAVPSAREPSSGNLIVFCEQDGVRELVAVRNQGTLDLLF